jgi:hypothetical protein
MARALRFQSPWGTGFVLQLLPREAIAQIRAYPQSPLRAPALPWEGGNELAQPAGLTDFSRRSERSADLRESIQNTMHPGWVSENGRGYERRRLRQRYPPGQRTFRAHPPGCSNDLRRVPGVSLRSTPRYILPSPRDSRRFSSSVSRLQIDPLAICLQPGFGAGRLRYPFFMPPGSD